MMDWSQASTFESFVFGIGVMTCLVGITLLLAVIFSGLRAAIKSAVGRCKRKRKTTVAFRCDKCQHNVEDGNFRRCEQFGMNISCAPVLYPGCSWGIEKEAVKR